MRADLGGEASIIEAAGYSIRKKKDREKPIGFTSWVARPASTTLEIRIDQDVPVGPAEWEQFHMAYLSALSDAGTARENGFKEREIGVGYVWWTSYPGFAIDQQMRLWLRIKTRLFVFRYFAPWVQCYATGARVHRIFGAQKEPYVSILLSEE